MAEVLAEHHISPLNEGGWACSSLECDFWDGSFEQATEHQAEVLAANGYGKLEDATRLIRDLTDPDDCYFDHHGGCQSHGYLGLEPGEMCPQLEAKAWLRDHGRPE